MTEQSEQLSPLEQFHREITELKIKEAEGGITVHLRDLTPENLTEKDMLIYNKFKDKILDLNEFREYRHIVCNEDKNTDSCYFAAFLGNQFNYWKEVGAI